MLTFIAFILTMLGSLNWLLIGFLQYDFIAGFFGFQASMFSRIFYILFGIGAVYLLIRIIVNKGTVKVFERKKEKVSLPAIQPASNVEASREQTPQEKDTTHLHQDRDFFENYETSEKSDNLFDEHFRNNN